MMTLWFSRLFFTLLSVSFCFFRRPPLSCVPLFLQPLLCSQRSRTSCSPSSLSSPFCVGSFSGILPEIASSVLFLGPLRLFFVSFRLIRRGARVKLTGFRFHRLLLSWVWVALLICVLVVTLRLSPVLDGLGVPSIVRLWLNTETLLRRLLFPWTRVRGELT